MPIRKTNNGILNDISNSFRPFVRELWKDLNFGLCRSKVDIEKLHSSGSDKNNLADQFTLILPYAGDFLRWEVLFDASRPWFAPDFRFDDENFLSNITSNFIQQHIPSLAKWNKDDPKALSCVVSELMNIYREYQKRLLSEDENSRAYFEYTALVGDCITSENDIEILVGHGENVSFMIKLNIEHSRLPALFNDDFYENPGGECAVLLVRYPNPTKADLIMSPLVNRAVGDISLPIIHPTAVLLDYVPEVTELINRKIEMVIQNEKLRREVLSQFIVKYEGGILEHDSNSASFLFNVNNFYCVLSIEIGVNFPEKPLSLTLRSVYHSNKTKPYFKVLTDCPYSRIEQYIIDEIRTFKIECDSSVSKTNDKL